LRKETYFCWHLEKPLTKSAGFGSGSIIQCTGSVSKCHVSGTVVDGKIQSLIRNTVNLLFCDSESEIDVEITAAVLRNATAKKIEKQLSRTRLR
jgi:hypothetical protein